MALKFPLNGYAAPLGKLDHLGFSAYAPHLHLQTWVQCYWSAQALLPDTGTVANLYPDGGITLIIDFTSDNQAFIHLNAIQSISQMHLSGRIDRMGIRFHPGGLFQLLDIDVPAIIGDDFNSDALYIPAIDTLKHRISTLTPINQRIRFIDEWLLEQANQRNAKNGLIQHLIPQLQFCNNSIDELSQHIALSKRQLEQKFREEVGLSPIQVKQFSRIRRARQLIIASPELSLVDIAQTAGFYDQAHFIRQFQKVTDQTPGQYRQKKMSQKYNPQE